MADTTPRNTSQKDETNLYIDALKENVDILNKEIKDLNSVIEKQGKSIHKRQIALIRIYNIFDETMHTCKLKLNSEGRMTWMQEIARVASAITIPIKQVIDEPIEPANVEPIKSAKIIGVGQAGEKSGI